MDNWQVALLSCGVLCILPASLIAFGWALGRGVIHSPYKVVRNDKAVRQSSVALKRPGETK